MTVQTRELVENGRPTGIFAYEIDGKTTTYVMPVSTMPAAPRSAKIDFAKSSTGGGYVKGMMADGGIQDVEFRTVVDPAGKEYDSATVHFHTAVAKKLNAPAAEKQLKDFTASALAKIAKSELPMPLVSPVRFVTEADFKNTSARFAAIHSPAEKYLVSIDTVIEIFNEQVARRHKGEVERIGYGQLDGKNVLMVGLKGNCGGKDGAPCSGSDFTVKIGLGSMLSTYSAGLVDKIEVSSSPRAAASPV